MMLSQRVMRRFLYGAQKKKRMIMMMGPPAAGKGFFLGEPEKDKSGKPLGPPKNKFGWKLPQMLVDADGKPLLNDDDIPDEPAQDESDNHLKALQHAEAFGHHQALADAHKEGPAAFKKALADHWYDTKDGDRVELGKHISYDDFPDEFDGFYKKTNKDFYVSMRGWHDDARQHNEQTGKPKERFKDQARHLFDESVATKTENVKDMLIVDSAGEDIDAQDFRGQIERAKANGFEVTVIFLHPEQADTELSNLARGKVQGKRMVDQADISNWYKNNADALEEIQKAQPHNFCHYRKGPPDADPKKAAEMRAKAREQMNKLAGMSDDERAKAEKEVKDVLYNVAPYQLHKQTTYGLTLNGLPKKPEAEDLATAVEAMNRDAQKRAKSHASSGKGDSSSDKDDDEGKAEKKKPVDKPRTRMNFLKSVGDRQISNPNPEARKRYPKVKLRYLPWEYLQPYYEKWKAQRAASKRVYARYMGNRMAASGQEILKKWMTSLAEDLGKIKAEGYKVSAKPGSGPLAVVTIKGASEDATTARKAREAAVKVVDKWIEKNSHKVPGFKSKVQSFNKGEDVLLECTVIFP